MEYNFRDVAITKCLLKNESNAVSKGLKLIKAKELIKQEDTVVIIPNWVNADKPNPKEGVVVGTDTLRAIIKWVKKSTPRRIVVACGSGGGNTREIMKKVGYDKIIKEEKVEFIDFNKGPYVEIELNHTKPNKIKVNQIYKEMTKLISFTQLKIHEEATMSAGIKNVAMSFPTTEEQGTPKKDKGIHDDLHGFIRSMIEKIKIDISIVSLNPVMVATGPTKGISKHTGLVVVGNNPISVDTVCARLLGYLPQGIRYLYELSQTNPNETNIDKINILGIKLDKAENILTNKVYNDSGSID